MTTEFFPLNESDTDSPRSASSFIWENTQFTGSDALFRCVVVFSLAFLLSLNSLLT